MSSLKANYEIIAIGNIRLRWIPNLPTKKQYVQNRDIIEEIWQKTWEESGRKLFNGTLLNFLGLNERERERERERIEVTGYFVEYKHFLAQRKQPELNLGIKPIGVSGIIILKEANMEYVIFAKRASDTTEYPGFFELVPSGSIDKECADNSGIVDYKSKLLSEFTEETGLSRECVKDISGFAFVLDTNDNVYDVCCKIVIDNTERDLVIQKFSSSKEYQSPIFVSIGELDDFIKLNYNSIVPTSMALVEAYIRSMKS